MRALQQVVAHKKHSRYETTYVFGRYFLGHEYQKNSAVMTGSKVISTYETPAELAERLAKQGRNTQYPSHHLFLPFPFFFSVLGCFSFGVQPPSEIALLRRWIAAKSWGPSHGIHQGGPYTDPSALCQYLHSYLT